MCTSAEDDVKELINNVSNVEEKSKVLFSACDNCDVCHSTTDNLEDIAFKNTSNDTHPNHRNVSPTDRPKDCCISYQEEDTNSVDDDNLVESQQCVRPNKCSPRTELLSTFPALCNDIQISNSIRNVESHDWQTQQAVFGTRSRKLTLENDHISKGQPYLENCGSHDQNCMASDNFAFFRGRKGRQRSVLEPDIDIDRLVKVLLVQTFDPEASSGQKWRLIVQEYYDRKRKCARLYNFCRKWRLLIHSKMKNFACHQEIDIPNLLAHAL